MRFKDKVVLVTGGNSGIGRGIAQEAAREGAKVAIAGRDAAKGRETLAALKAGGTDAAFFPAELAQEAEVKSLISSIVDRFGRIDVLVNCAGAGARRCGVERSDTPGERLRKVMGANLDSAYFAAAYAMPHLRAASGGAIVNISSTATFHGNWGSYGVAKAGLEALTRALATEGAPHNIRVNAVSPGWIKTETVAGANVGAASGKIEDWEKGASLLGRMGTPREIAKAVLFLASDDASFVTGTVLIVDGGLVITDYPSLPYLDTVGAWKLFAGTLEEESE